MQRTPEWYMDRCGKITASCFKDVMTKPRAKSAQWSDTALSYAYEVVGERLTGEPTPSFGSQATDWGIEHEPEARDLYSLLYGNECQEVGFQVHPELSDVGASPDSLIGEDGVIEIKCPITSREHVRTLASREMPKEHLPQVQGVLWVTGRQWCDFISYHPKFPHVDIKLCVIRIERDDKYIKELEERVRVFRHMLLQLQGSIQGVGATA